MATAYVIGAGVAGLSAAVRLSEAGWRVVLMDAAGQAGGRCRSFEDAKLGCLIDNGNHLLLSGNKSARRFLSTIGAEDELLVADDAAIPFADLASGERWTVRPNAGPLGWWIFAPSRRVPGTSAGDYIAALRLRRAGDRTVSQLFDPSLPIFRRYWDPLTVAVLNTSPERAAARLLWPVMTETILRGADAARPCIARRGLSQTFVDPALRWLAANGARVALNTRVRALGLLGDAVNAIDTTGERLTLEAGDRIVLAVPPQPAAQLLPGLRVPDEHNPIVNLHFREPHPPEMDRGRPVLGLIGGTAQWLFAREDVLSVTISAAEREAEMAEDELVGAVWHDILRAFGRDETTPPPPCRVIREKRATFAQTPEALSRRPKTGDGPVNLALAGDWTDTGLPATIEGAIRSGEWAARHIGRPA